MALPRNETLNQFAGQLRKRMTKEEHRLWQYCLRNCPVKFYRQRVIGNYIVDFYAASAKLVIELDGSQHYEPEEQKRDAERTAYLNSCGLRVLRFSNLDVMQRFDSVCEAIYEEIRYTPQRTRTVE